MSHNIVVFNGVMKSQCELIGVIMNRTKQALLRASSEQTVSLNEAMRHLKEASDIYSSEIVSDDHVDPPTATFTHPTSN